MVKTSTFCCPVYPTLVTCLLIYYASPSFSLPPFHARLKVFSSISLAGLSGSRVESPMCTSTSSGSENGSADEGDVVVDGVGDINSDRDGDATGYQHRASIAAMICNHRGPIFVASNSPIQHVGTAVHPLLSSCNEWCMDTCRAQFYPASV